MVLQKLRDHQHIKVFRCVRIDSIHNLLVKVQQVQLKIKTHFYNFYNFIILFIYRTFESPFEFSFNIPQSFVIIFQNIKLTLFFIEHIIK